MYSLQLVEYLNNGSVIVNVMGKQYIRKSAVAGKKSIHTRELIKSDRGVFSKYDKIRDFLAKKYFTKIIFQTYSQNFSQRKFCMYSV